MKLPKFESLTMSIEGSKNCCKTKQNKTQGERERIERVKIYIHVKYISTQGINTHTFTNTTHTQIVSNEFVKFCVREQLSVQMSLRIQMALAYGITPNILVYGFRAISKRPQVCS